MRQSKNGPSLLFGLLLLLLALRSVAAPAPSWEPIGFPLEEAITGISFLNPETAYVVTSAGSFIRTYDGCKNWSTALRSPMTGVPLEDVCFLNKDVGVTCGRRGAIYWTTNGGYRWKNCSIGDTIPWLLSVQPFDSVTAVVVGIAKDTAHILGGVLYRTVDGGANWIRIPEKGLGFGEFFYRPGSPICFQSYGELHYSRDLGTTWQTRPTVAGKPMRATAFFGKTGIMAGNQGACAYTDNGGDTWTVEKLPEKDHFTSALLVDDKIGYVAGVGPAAFQTTDGGKHWNDITPGLTFDVYQLRLAGKYLYATGTRGGMVRRLAR